MPHPLPPAARLASGTAKVTALAALLGIGLGLGAGTALGPPPGGLDRRHPVNAAPRPLERAMTQHRCSPTGVASRVEPRSALVQSPSGAVRFVDFRTGWRIYTRHGATRLVAVCLDPPPR